MKKLKTLLLVLVMLSVIGLKGQSVYAMETGDEKDTEAAAREKYWIQDGCIVDEEGHQYSSFYNGSGEPVSLEEALKVFNSTGDDEMLPEENESAASDQVEFSVFHEDYVGEEVKLTPDFSWGLIPSYEVSPIVVPSFKGTLEESAKEILYQTVKNKAAAPIVNKETKTAGFQVMVSQPLKQGETGAIYFQPYYIEVKGSYLTDHAPLQTFTAYYPKLTYSGLADGVYYYK